MAPTPILTLNSDILHEIFMHNTDTSRDGAQRHESCLYTARAASQVSHSWRQLLLNSPSIWGKIFNINAVCTGALQWRQEVFQRTQAAPLCVRAAVHVQGDIYGFTDHFAFLTLVLQDEWERVESLNLRIADETGDCHVLLFKLLNRPAPRLWSLCLAISGGRAHQRQSLLDNDVPLLQSISLEGFKLQIPSRRLNMVRRLTLTSPPPIQVVGNRPIITPARPHATKYTVSEILEMVACMPLLEELNLLKVLYVERSGAGEALGPVELPHLKNLFLTTDESVAGNIQVTSILSYLSIPFATCFAILVLALRPADDWRDLDSRLVAFLGSIVGSSSAVALELEFSGDVVMLSVRPPGPVVPRQFLTVLTLKDSRTAKTFVPILLQRMSALWLRNVKSFRLIYGNLNPMRSTDPSEIIAFFLTLDAVEVLEITISCLQHLFKATTPIPPILPSLRCLKFNPQEVEMYVDMAGAVDRQAALLGFLQKRLQDGFRQIEEIHWDSEEDWREVFGDIQNDCRGVEIKSLKNNVQTRMA